MNIRTPRKTLSRPNARPVETLENRRLLSGVLAPTPFLGLPYVAGQTIEAENFDNGGEGVAYHNPAQAAPANTSYRADTSITVANGGSNGLNVSNTVVGQWLDYTVTIPVAGKYVLSARVASNIAGNKFHATFNGAISTSGISVQKTTSATSFHTLWSNGVSLPAGTYTMRITMDSLATGATNVGNFDSFNLTQSVAPTTFGWTSSVASTFKQFEGQGRVLNGKLYTFGGYQTVAPETTNLNYQVYDPTTNKWTNLGKMPIGRSDWGAVADDAGVNMYFVGGLFGPQPGVDTAQVWDFNGVTNTWTQLPSLPIPISEPSVALLNGELHVMGGNSDNEYADTNGHFVLDLNALAQDPTTTWTTAAPLPDIRDHAMAQALNGKIYLLGGEIKSPTANLQQTVCWSYDPTTDAWSRIADIPIPESHAESATFVLNGKILMAGGQVDDYLATNTIIEYDPAADRWYRVGDLPGLLQGTIMQPLGNNQFILSGGYKGTGNIATNATWIGTLPATYTPPKVETPFLGQPFNTNQIIEAENYDAGGEGISFHDNTSANLGGANYRPGDGVDIQTGGSNGYNIGHAAAGEWLNYSINIPVAGTYSLQAAVSQVATGGSFHVNYSGLNLSGSIKVPNTGSWQNFQSVTSAPFTLAADQTILQIRLDTGASNGAVGNFDWFQFQLIAPAVPPLLNYVATSPVDGKPVVQASVWTRVEEIATKTRVNDDASTTVTRHSSVTAWATFTPL